MTELLKILPVFLYLLLTAAILRVVGLRLFWQVTISAGRTLIQVFILGFILLGVFRVESLLLSTLVLVVMITVAAWTASSHSPHRRTFLPVLGAIFGTTLILVIPLTFAGVIDTRSPFLIPIAGMIIGNAMNSVALGLERLDREFHGNRGTIEASLALGIDARTASRELLRQAINAAIIPRLNTLKTTGLVHIPGLMTGMLLSGESPLRAAEMQAIVVYLVFMGAALASVIALMATYRRYFRGNYAMNL